MLIGIYGLFFELSNPGAFAPGILGGICLLLALFAFQALPVNYAGVALILLGTVLLILEVKVPSFGALTIGGVAALVLGSLMLFDSAEPWARVSLRVMIPAPDWCSWASSCSACGSWSAARNDRRHRPRGPGGRARAAWWWPSAAATPAARWRCTARCGTPWPTEMTAGSRSR